MAHTFPASLHIPALGHTGSGHHSELCVCVCVCICMHACMVCILMLLRLTWNHVVCADLSVIITTLAVSARLREHTHTHRTSQLNVKEGIFLIRASREDRTSLIPLRFLTYVVSQALTLFISSHRQDILMRSAPSHSLWYICVRARVCERERACCIILLL